MCSQKTPFELRLATRLNTESQRFHNQWICNWYNINIRGNATDVDDFRGGRIRLGGCLFEGQPQQFYWSSIDRYLKTYIQESMKLWDAETVSYPSSLRRSSLDATEGMLISFSSQVIANATKTDRRLRGNGYPDQVPVYNSSGSASAAKAEAMRMAEAHRMLLGDIVRVEKSPNEARVLYDVFVSHASEDKASFVAEFVTELQAVGLRVWYDANSLGWGSSLRQEIDNGLATCRFGVVVLSPSFFSKPWPQAELDALLARVMTGDGRILPIWHQLSHDEVVARSPLMSGRMARETSRTSAREMALEIEKICQQL